MRLFERLVSKFGGTSITELAENMALSILPKLHTASAHSVDLDWLCTQLGVVVHPVPTAEYAGQFHWNKRGTPVITLRRDEDIPRKRFTQAHELGHFLVQKTIGARHTALFGGVAISEEKHVEEERIADAIAAAILIPRRFLDTIDPNMVTPNALDRDMKMYGVTRDVCIQRYAAVSQKTWVYFRTISATLSDPMASAIVDSFSVFKPDGMSHRFRNDVWLSSGADFASFGRESRRSLLLEGRRRKPLCVDVSIRRSQAFVPFCEAIGTVLEDADGWE